MDNTSAHLHRQFQELSSTHNAVVVQISGGVESTTILAACLEYFSPANVYGITFNDDSAFYKTKDIVGNKKVIEYYNMTERHWLCNIPQSDFLEFAEDDEYHDVGFCPGYKLAINTASMSYAHKVGASVVLIGNMGDNVYGDERPEALQLMQDVYNFTYGDRLHNPIRIVAPFAVNKVLTKADVIRFGLSLEDPVPYERTLSCGDLDMAGGYHCGRCQWCTYRRKAFIEAGVADPTTYLFPSDVTTGTASF